MEQLGTKKTWQGDTVALDESDEEWYSQVIGQSGEHKKKDKIFPLTNKFVTNYKFL